MKRWHQERDLMLRRWRMEIGIHEGTAYQHCSSPLPPAGEEKCHCYRGPGFLRKRKPLDCGHTRCGVCHFEKFYARPSRSLVRRRSIVEAMQ